ncbi:hypothetical protein SRABI26_03707 [Arthrobacter sp. Bi26]|nr:hypothetical protein SRABI26_03707 [Arthrobacter sp. Bi26]
MGFRLYRAVFRTPAPPGIRRKQQSPGELDGRLQGDRRRHSRDGGVGNRTARQGRRGQHRLPVLPGQQTTGRERDRGPVRDPEHQSGRACQCGADWRIGHGVPDGLRQRLRREMHHDERIGRIIMPHQLGAVGRSLQIEHLEFQNQQIMRTEDAKPHDAAHRKSFCRRRLSCPTRRGMRCRVCRCRTVEILAPRIVCFLFDWAEVLLPALGLTEASSSAMRAERWITARCTWKCRRAREERNRLMHRGWLCGSR